MFLQLGIGGAAMLVLHLHLRSLPTALAQVLKPVTDSLSGMARSMDRVAEQHGRLADRMARIEGKFDAAFDLTPVETPAMIARQREKTPVQGVPLEGRYRIHKPRDG